MCMNGTGARVRRGRAGVRVGGAVHLRVVVDGCVHSEGLLLGMAVRAVHVHVVVDGCVRSER